MESTKTKLIEWTDILEKAQNEEGLNPIDTFLFLEEPAGRKDTQHFREMLKAALNFETEEEKMERNGELISSFIDFCEENGVSIPDGMYEDFFGA